MCCIIFSLSMAIASSFSILPDSSEARESPRDASGALGARVVSELVLGGVVLVADVEKEEEKEGV